MKLVRDTGVDAVALSAMLVAIASPSVWGRIYFENNSAGFLLAVGGMAIAVLLCLVALCSALWPALQPRRLLRSVTVAAGSVWLVVVLSGGTLARSRRDVVLLAATLATVLAYRALRLEAAVWWPRARAALIAAALVFFFSSPLIGRWSSAEATLLPPVSESNRVPTVWLMLDEASSGASDQLASPLRKLGMWTYVGDMESAGLNTLDIVPSIVARRVMGPSTAPCGATAVCSGSGSVDFARIGAGRPGVDLVGLYHRYCAMDGLRSCTKDTRRVSSWAHQVADLHCDFRRWVGTGAPCLQALALHDLDVRRLAIQAALDAPFWREGGDLFVHVLLPHLPASADPMPSLAEAYEHNLASAAALIGTIGVRLQQRFPDFRLVVFSDHALRAVDKCNQAYSGKCDRPAKYVEPFTVPLIVAAPKAISTQYPRSNLHVFDLKLY